jgi:uncharacterized protein YbjT (DUF2867 family)
MSEVRALVFGATGYTGRAVVEALASAGVEVVAHIRPDSPRLATWQSRFEALGARVDATPWEASAIAATIARCAPTVVFGLLGITRSGAKREAAARGTRPATYAEVDVGMTNMAIAGAAQLTAPPRFVYLSSLGAGTPGTNAYLQARAEVERTLRASGVPYTIARPSFITGEGRDEDRRLERVGASAADVALRVLGGLGAKRTQARYRSRTNEELAASLVRLAFSASAANRVVEPEDL